MLLVNNPGAGVWLCDCIDPSQFLCHSGCGSAILFQDQIWYRGRERWLKWGCTVRFAVGLDRASCLEFNLDVIFSYPIRAAGAHSLESLLLRPEIDLFMAEGAFRDLQEMADRAGVDQG